jgi:hypothetical protein
MGHLVKNSLQINRYLKAIEVKLRHYGKIRIFAGRNGTSPPNKVAMFHGGRCGSQVLGDLLKQHPDVFWDSEIYTRSKVAWEKRRKPNNSNWFVDPLDLLRAQMPNVKPEFYGFEVKFHQLRVLRTSLSDYLDGLEGLGFQYFISLDRRNHLRQIISAQVASNTNRYHVLKGAKHVPAKIELDVKGVNLVDWLNLLAEDCANLHGLLQIKGLKHIAMTYEDDVMSDPKVGYFRLCNFLGVSNFDAAEVRYAKTNPGRLLSILENFEEVGEVLENTPFRWMLYE